jgi:Integrase core domain
MKKHLFSFYYTPLCLHINRIDSPKILLWQKRCLMRESYQPLLWESEAAGRKRGHDEYHKSERVVSGGGSRYRAVRGEERTHILEEFIASTGYHRKYALSLLNHPISKGTARKKRARPRQYVFAVHQALVMCWRAANGICSKRLVPYLPELVRVLEQHGELHLDPPTKERLLALSAATADRLLQAERKLAKPHGLGTTKPGTLLKSAIPIRTFAEWDEAEPGFTEIDLVVHYGTTTRGEYLHSLTMTDSATAWTECVALRNRGQQSVFQALVLARERLPFPLRGIDSDNGSEFINAHLLRYCQNDQLTFTRSRPYKKNDQAYVEQKNWSIVRQLVGYERYESASAFDGLQALYEVIRLYINFFQPSMKLVFKERVSSKVKKRYDKAKTPYQRVLESEQVIEEVKVSLRQQYVTLNPVAVASDAATPGSALEAGRRRAD